MQEQDPQIESEEDEKGPTRRCLASGERRAKEEMIRFVVSPEGEAVPDLAERLPGRGFWLSARRDVVNTAAAKGLFSKAARRSVKAAPDLAARVEALLKARFLELLGLAKRAGQAVAGFDKAEAMARKGSLGLLIEAADGAEGGREKLRRLAPEAPMVLGLSAAEMGRALGREAAVHVALSPGRMAQGLKIAAEKLAAYGRDGQ